MKVNYLFRKFHSHQTSIEKLFNVIIPLVEKQGIEITKSENPYPVREILRSIIFFNNHQSQINHITGDIHWAILGTDSNRTILTIHDLVGMVQLSGVQKFFYFLFWVYFPIKKAKYITVISQKTKNEILKYLPKSGRKITVIPNCLTMETAYLDFTKKNLIPKILIVGTRHNKNIDRIIKSLKGIICELEIVGELNFYQQNFLQDNSYKFQNSKEISEEQLVLLYDRSDILCFPSLYEGFGLPILEAQARNCVVITSDVSPMREISGNAAELVNPESIEEIREAVLKVINNEERREELIKNGHENIKKYSKEKIAQQYIDLYKKIAKV